MTSKAKHMGTPSGSQRISRIIALLLLLSAAAAFIPSSGNAQRTARKLSKDDIVNLLTGDVSSDEVAQEARKSGISFQVTAGVEQEIRAAGGSDALIRVLRSLGPAAPAAAVNPPRGNPSASAPTLMVESNPGQSQVYVDDEPVGTTSQAGRLKLTRIAPGDHRVRVSLNGYQDYEQSVTLSAGGSASVAATLQRAQVSQITPPPQIPAPAQPQVQTPAQPIQPPTMSPMPHTGVVSFLVGHDHGQNAQLYCVGVMAIGNGMIYYKGAKGNNGIHNFEIPLNTVREAHRNNVYLVAIGGFHIRLKKGTNYNFVAFNQQGQYQPPDVILTAIDNAMGK